MNFIIMRVFRNALSPAGLKGKRRLIKCTKSNCNNIIAISNIFFKSFSERNVQKSNRSNVARYFLLKIILLILKTYFVLSPCRIQNHISKKSRVFTASIRFVFGTFSGQCLRMVLCSSNRRIRLERFCFSFHSSEETRKYDRSPLQSVTVKRNPLEHVRC